MKRYLIIGFLVILSCGKKPTAYRSFLNGQEITYPGVIQNPTVYPGDLRLLLTWHPSTDPSVAKYVVYWNNNADSVIIPATSHNPADTVKCYINNLSEYTYTFFVNSYDSAGNKSVTAEIDNARAYGPIYQASLHNRLPDPTTPFVVNADGSVTLKFATPDTVNITTTINYTNAAGVASKSAIGPADSLVTLPSYQSGASVLVQSSYLPVTHAIDTFWTLKADTFPQIFKLVQCDKSIFAEIDEPTDMKPYQSSTNVAMLWNGSTTPQGYPNIFHSDGANNLPQTITMDMGKVYNHLAVIQEIGRNCCHNPNDFEVWGIADTTGAFPTLASNDPGWKASNIAHGWTLLTEAFRSDDGSAPMNFNFISNPPPVRFIRVRVIQTVDQSNYVNMTQLTFWDKE
ncbi:DUF4998 domain-containing protein [Dinghuibacter silviterrae]|uniref:Uncharacterized protein DUF5000 n=1 Tax=Dinghuibacter silviterrae TaxID=1539049 RepID=A0A4R8DH97_9BACT|nr:DUF4998 domain-containing protein [Dinghuibacter silviterrae]TDW96877.1 uncharacterized protein DUF5000 [Dinghuibacter silviterrae]